MTVKTLTEEEKKRGVEKYEQDRAAIVEIIRLKEPRKKKKK